MDSPSQHNGIDYIKGTVDQSSTWETFEVKAAAAGSFSCHWSDSWGMYALGQHDVDNTRYYTVYAHLESCSIPVSSVSAGTKIGMAGLTGNASNGVLHLHFELSSGGYGSGCGCPRIDPYDLEAKRDVYPENGGNCGIEHFWMQCPTAASKTEGSVTQTESTVPSQNTPATGTALEVARNQRLHSNLHDLNPYGGFSNNTWLSGKLTKTGSDGGLHIWYGSPIEYRSNGVPTDTWMQVYG